MPYALESAERRSDLDKYEGGSCWDYIKNKAYYPVDRRQKWKIEHGARTSKPWQAL